MAERFTRLEDTAFQLDGGIEVSSHNGVLHIWQDEIGEVKLSPSAQFDLLQFLYGRRETLYNFTHLNIGQLPEWIQQHGHDNELPPWARAHIVESTPDRFTATYRGIEITVHAVPGGYYPTFRWEGKTYYAHSDGPAEDYDKTPEAAIEAAQKTIDVQYDAKRILDN